MKKVLIGFAAAVVLIIVVLLAIPLFLNIDSFRPQIVDAANRTLQGKISIQKLSLKLFPRFEFRAEGFQANAAAPLNQSPLLTMNVVSVEMPLLKILTGPELTVVLREPEVTLLTQGKDNNIVKFLPVPKADAPAETPPSEAPPQAVGEILQSLPGWMQPIVNGAKFHFAIQDGKVAIKDLSPAADSTPVEKSEIALADLDVELKNLGINKDMSIFVGIDPRVVMGDLSVGGRIEQSGTVVFQPEGKINNVSLRMQTDMDRLELRKGALFHKAAGTPLRAELGGKVAQSERIDVAFDQLGFQFANFKLDGVLKLDNATDPEQAAVEFSAKTAQTEIAPFGVFVPMIRDFDLKGAFSLDLQVSGPIKDPRFQIGVGLFGVGGSTPQLKTPLSDLKGQIRVSGSAKYPVVEVNPFTMKIGSSDLSVNLRNEGIQPIKTSLQVRSTLLNVDEILGLKALHIDPLAKKETAAAEADAPVADPNAPLDGALTSMAPTINEALKNPIIGQVEATMDVVFQKIQVLGAEFTNGTFNMKLKDRQLAIGKTGIGGYGGRVEFSTDLTLRPDDFRYRIDAQMKDIFFENLLKSHMPGWQKVLTGKMSGLFRVEGIGLSESDLEKNLKGSVGGLIQDGTIAIPVVKIFGKVMDSVAGEVNKYLDKLPAGLGAKAKPEIEKYLGRFSSQNTSKLGDRNERFKLMKFSNSIKGRRVNIDEISVIYDGASIKTEDIEFRGNGFVDFVRNLEMVGAMLIPPFKPTSDYFVGSSGRPEIPVKMAGKMTKPEPDYGYSVKTIGERVVNKLTGNVKAEAEARLRAEAERIKREGEAKLKAEADRLRQEAERRANEEKKKLEDAARKKLEEEAKKRLPKLKF